MSDLHELLAKHRAVAVAEASRVPEFGVGFTPNEIRFRKLNDPEVALALNAVAEVARGQPEHHGWCEVYMAQDAECECDCGFDKLNAALAHLTEVMQRKMGDEG